MLTRRQAPAIPLSNPDGTPLGAVDDWNQLASLAIVDNGEPLVYLDQAAPTIISRPAYAPADYRPLVRRGVAARLLRAQALLPDEYQLVLHDGWRAPETQQRLYDAELTRRLSGRALLDLDHDEHRALRQETAQYVSRPSDNPRFPAPHHTGGAVDVELFRDGRPLDFGSEFDEMSPRSALTYYETDHSNQNARDHRRILYQAMIGAGFEPYQHEWWHYNYGNQMAARHQQHRGYTVAPYYGAVEPDF